MPTPNATLLASVNGGAPTTGGITAAAGDTVQFTFQNTIGWRNSCRLELSFPDGFSLPSGWSSETVGGHTVYYVLGNTTPPVITLGPWGKYMPKLIVNGGVATDEATAISVPSPGGLLDLGHREAGQFGGSAEGWAADQRANLRTIEAGLGGGSGVVAPTADTLLLRGSAGEGRVARIETSIVRTTAGGDTVLQEGEDTYVRFRSQDTCDQPGDVRFDASTGEPFAYVDGRGEVSLREWTVRVPRFAPDAAAGDTVEIPISGPPGVLWTITAARYIANDILFADASNYAVLRVRVNDGGSFLGDAAIGNTTPSGTNSTGDWVPYANVNLTLQAGLLAFPFNGTDRIAFAIGKVGTGVIVPAGVLEVVCVPWQDP
jgi:hypothetical protein